MHPDLEKAFELIKGKEFILKIEDIAYEIAECKQLEARIEALESLVIAHIAEKESKNEEEIEYEYQGLWCHNLLELASEFLSKYGTGNSKENPG